MVVGPDIYCLIPLRGENLKKTNLLDFNEKDEQNRLGTIE